MSDVFIYDAVRTPRGKGKADGALHEVTAIALASTTLRALRDRNNLDTSLVEDVVLGCVDPVGEAGGDIARSAVLASGYSHTVPGIQVNRFCASGLDAVALAAGQIAFGAKDLAIGGGVESMSRVGMSASGGAIAVDPAVALPAYFMPQGIAADLISTKYGFTRTQCDEYAVRSHQRAHQAWEEGRFAKSVVAVRDVNGLVICGRDETIRPSANMQSLGALNASFKMMGEMGGFDSVAIQSHPEIERIDYMHHAGNSSGIVDGSSAVLIGNKRGGKNAGLKPRAKIRAFATVGSDLGLMLTGPVDVTKVILKKAGMSLADIDLFELNEAFASVVLRFQQAFEIPDDKLNVNGGAIAMGHPLGATGGMILGTVLDELERTNKQIALITLCVAAGMGTACIIERV
jgi:acetyl-CoA C-acetyltransferase